MSSFSFGATGANKTILIENLENQRDKAPGHTSLKNQIIEHVASHIESLPVPAHDFSLSVSVNLNYSTEKPEIED